MSCWFLSKKDIDALVYGAREWGDTCFCRLEDPKTGVAVNAKFAPDAIGQALWRYNMDAYCDRYPDTERDYAVCDAYEYPRDTEYDIGEVWGTLHCYMYQCSDEHGWDHSEVRNWCHSLEYRIVRALFKMTGHTPTWGIGGVEML